MIHTAQTAIPIPYDELAAFCEKHQIARLWLFGSVLRDDFMPDSDIDVLVEFHPDHVPGLAFHTWRMELEAILGHSVDLTTPDALSKYIKERVMNSAKVIYERTG